MFLVGCCNKPDQQDKYILTEFAFVYTEYIYKYIYTHTHTRSHTRAHTKTYRRKIQKYVYFCVLV